MSENNSLLITSEEVTPLLGVKVTRTSLVLPKNIRPEDVLMRSSLGTAEFFAGKPETASGWYSVSSGGRSVCCDMGFQTDGLRVGPDGQISIDPDKKHRWNGISVKGDPTLSTLSNFNQLSLGALMAPWYWGRKLARQVGVLGDASKVSGNGILGSIITVGELSAESVNSEFDETGRLFALGARVELPLIAGEKELPTGNHGKGLVGGKYDQKGILVRAFRTPYTFEELMRIPLNRPGLAVQLMEHGLEILVEDGLINAGHLAEIKDVNQRVYNDTLFNFYLIKAAEILGADMALIQTHLSIRNRTPQNTSIAFEHRDVSKDNTGRMGKPTSFQDFGSVLMEIGNIIRVGEHLHPRAIGVSTIGSDKPTLYDEIVARYLDSYFAHGGGLSRKAFKALWLAHGVTPLRITAPVSEKLFSTVGWYI